MSKNREPDGDIIITDKALEAFKSFASYVDLQLLDKGIWAMFLSALGDDLSRELWFDDFLEEFKLYHDFKDALIDEYGLSE